MIVSSLKEHFNKAKRANVTTLTSHQLTTQSTFNGSISVQVPNVRMQDEVSIKMEPTGDITEDTVDLERPNGTLDPSSEKAQFL